MYPAGDHHSDDNYIDDSPPLALSAEAIRETKKHDTRFGIVVFLSFIIAWTVFGLALSGNVTGFFFGGLLLFPASPFILIFAFVVDLCIERLSTQRRVKK